MTTEILYVFEYGFSFPFFLYPFYRHTQTPMHTRMDTHAWTHTHGHMHSLYKAVSKRPNEASFNACSLSKVPKYLFYNNELSMLSMDNNFLRERPPNMTKADIKADSLGYIDDLAKFTRLNVLSLAVNNLCSFPMSLCNITSLVDLNLSSNRLQTLPPEICQLQRCGSGVCMHVLSYHVW